MAETIKIGGELESTATGNIVAAASAIKDKTKNKYQSEINNDVARHETEIHGTGGIDSRLSDVEQMEQIVLDGGEAQIAQGSDFTNPDATKRAKVPTVGAIVDGLNDGVYDVSKRNPTAGPNSDGKFTLDYILDNANTLIPTGWRHGGMTISFVHTSDNNYMQYRCIANTFTTDITKWQGGIIVRYDNSDLLEVYQFVGKDIDNLFQDNKAINLNSYSVGDVVNTNPITNNAVKCLVVPVVTGNSFIITGRGGVAPRLWALLDTDKKLLSVSRSDENLSNYVLTATSDGYLIVNVISADTYKITYNGKDKEIVSYVDNKFSEASKIYSVFDSPSHYYINYDDGLIKYNGSLANICTTKYLPVKAGITIYGCKGGSSARCAFYDAHYNFISAHSSATGGNNAILTLTDSIIPANAKYFRCTGNNLSTNNLPYIIGLDIDSAFDYSNEISISDRNNTLSSYKDKILKNLTIVNNQSEGTVVDVNAFANNNGYNCAVVKCYKDDIITISGKGAGSNYRLWAFIDKDYKMVTKEAADKLRKDYIFIAPEDGYLVCNSNRYLNIIKNGIAKEYTFKKARWMAMGDSITEGYYSYYNDQQEGVSDNSDNETWVTKVAAINGWTLDNKGVGGEGWDDPGLEHGARTRVDNMDFSNTDLVTIAYGINDYKGNKLLGSMSDDVATVYSVVTNMRYVIEKIIQSNPLCKIVIITPLNARGYDDELGDESTNYAIGHANTRGYTLEDMYQAMVEVCEYYGIQYIDMTHRSIINRKNMETTLPDGVHPSIDAHLAIGKQLAKEITFY